MSVVEFLIAQIARVLPVLFHTVHSDNDNSMNPRSNREIAQTQRRFRCQTQSRKGRVTVTIMQSEHQSTQV